MEPETLRGRFAPSPTGRMHLGNIYCALLSWLSAKSNGGEWLLRIEDIDPQRSRQQWADLIMEDLEWLGLKWDEEPVYQSHRGDIYNYYLEKLKGRGLIYPSYKTRAERLAVSAPQSNEVQETRESETSETLLGLRGADTVKVEDKVIEYVDGHYGRQSVDMKHDIGDFIVRRRDGAWAYQLAVVVDDALMGVTEVVRGCDLLQSAAQQIYLGSLLGFREIHYSHVPLLCNKAGQRLSKRDRSLDMGVLRTHYTADEIIGHLAYYAHLLPEPEPCSPSQLLPYFEWGKIAAEKSIIVE